MVRNPSYHHAYNALGYSLAERGVRLAEAKELILKALSFAPKDPFITDSLAWVEFRQGNSAEALRLLETAFGIRPDADIAAHLGEVLWTQGNQERAKAIWRESLRLNPDNETLRETLQRLNIKL
jgi:tetratricopeptide (TPR) repeat protein